MNYYKEIKTNLINNEVYKKVKDYSKNRSDLTTYYNVGKLLSEAGKHYGENIIENYAYKLQKEVNKKYNYRTLYRIRQLYIFFQNKKVSTVSTKLSWSHYCELLTLNDDNKIIYYIKITEQQNLSVRELRNKIKSSEYERLSIETRNKLITKEEVDIKDLVPNPILIRNKNNKEIINEKCLHQLILEDIETFMKQLGQGFSFIGSEYKIKIGDRYYYIDLLLFNIKFNCYTVIELKIGEFKKEYIGQIEVYMNYINENIKDINQDKTIGIIILKEENNYIIKYCSDKRIISRKYELV